MLSLKQSHLDGLHYLRLAKCSPIVMVRIQMEKSDTAGSREYMPIYFRIGYNN